jgi:hypothetical protein
VKDAAAYEKKTNFNEAKAALDSLNSDIAKANVRLALFEGFEKKDDDKSLPPCEPATLYNLDAKKIPQLNGEAAL